MVKRYSSGHPKFSTMPDLDMTLPTRPDIGRHRELKMSATKPELIMSSDCGFPMSDNVGQCRQCHIRVGHFRKCGVAVGIASPSVSVQKLFPLPVSWLTFWVSVVGLLGMQERCREFRCGWYNAISDSHGMRHWRRFYCTFMWNWVL